MVACGSFDRTPSTVWLRRARIRPVLVSNPLLRPELDTSHAALEAPSSGESIEFVQEPLCLLRHKDADLFPLKAKDTLSPPR